jgi:cytochrome o ubiquinol oxidase subunit II
LRGGFAGPSISRLAADGGLGHCAKSFKVEKRAPRKRIGCHPPRWKRCMQDRHYAHSVAPKRRGPDRTMTNRLSAIGRGLVVGAALLLASCSQGVLDPQGPVASAELLLLVNATAIMLVVVVPVIVLTLAFAWWYRSSNSRADHSPEWAYEGGVEFVVWSIPALVVILLAGVNWIGSHQLDPRAPLASEKKPIPVEVVSLDWKWLFIYPDQGIAAVNQLVIPAGTPVAFRLTAATVMDSFFVPQLGSQIYTMGGMTTHLNLLADQPGEYPGISANFSGDGFADMRFVVKAVSADAFAGWVAKVRSAGPALDDAGYAELAKPSENVPPSTYRSVVPKLFDRILAETKGGPEQRAGTAWCPPARQRGG